MRLAPEQGYIALITVSFLALAMSSAVAVASFGAALLSQDLIAEEKWVHARQLAWSCLEYARLQLTLRPDYSGNETVILGSNECRIGGITISEQSLEILTDAELAPIHIKLSTQLRTTDFNVISSRLLASN